MQHTKFQVQDPARSITFQILAFIEVKWSIFWPSNQQNFLNELIMGMKQFGPLHNYIRPLAGAIFSDFFGLNLAPCCSVHCVLMDWRWYSSHRHICSITFLHPSSFLWKFRFCYMNYKALLTIPAGISVTLHLSVECDRLPHLFYKKTCTFCDLCSKSGEICRLGKKRARSKFLMTFLF